MLEAGLSYASLVGDPASGVASNEGTSLLRVEAGNPDDSFLIIKLEGTDARLVGDAMPLGSAPLDSASIQAIRDWILNGAAND